MQLRRNPLIARFDIFRVDRQALNQVVTGTFGLRSEVIEMRPGCFGIDVVRRHWRHPAPVINTCADRLDEITVIEIGWRLNAHVRAEYQARNGDSPAQFIHRRLCGGVHFGAGLGAKILNDDFLQVTILRMQFTQGQQ